MLQRLHGWRPAAAGTVKAPGLGRAVELFLAHLAPTSPKEQQVSSLCSFVALKMAVFGKLVVIAPNADPCRMRTSLTGGGSLNRHSSTHRRSGRGSCCGLGGSRGAARALHSAACHSARPDPKRQPTLNRLEAPRMLPLLSLFPVMQVLRSLMSLVHLLHRAQYSRARPGKANACCHASCHTNRVCDVQEAAEIPP